MWTPRISIRGNSPANKYRLKETKEKTAKGAKLWKVTQCIIVWSNRKEAKPYWSFRAEPSARNVAVFKGKRLVITEMIRKKVEDEYKFSIKKFVIYVKLIWE